jgi:hypothetical protein
VAVGGLVQVAADPHRAATTVQRRLDQIGDLGLPGARLGADDHDDRPVLADSAARPGRKDDPGQNLAALAVGQRHRHEVALSPVAFLGSPQSSPWDGAGRSGSCAPGRPTKYSM